MGTIPKSDVLLTTDLKTDRIVSSGIFSTDFPNWPSNAVSEKVPSGPKKDIVKVDSVDLQLEIISLKMFLI